MSQEAAPTIDVGTLSFVNAFPPFAATAIAVGGASIATAFEDVDDDLMDEADGLQDAGNALKKRLAKYHWVVTLAPDLDRKQFKDRCDNYSVSRHRKVALNVTINQARKQD